MTEKLLETIDRELPNGYILMYRRSPDETEKYGCVGVCYRNPKQDVSFFEFYDKLKKVLMGD